MGAVEERQAKMGWWPLIWPSFPKDVREPQTPGFVGGHMSHAEVWREALDVPGLEWVMVLEDDATPSPGYGLGWDQTWCAVASQISLLRELGEEWDIMYVGRTPSYTPEGKELTDLVVEAGYCLGSHTYCLSVRG